MFTIEQATKAQKGSRGIAVDGLDSQHHAPAALLLGKRPGTYCTGG